MRAWLEWTHLTMSAALAVAAMAGGWHELFVSVPGRHTPRIRVVETAAGARELSAHLDVPTVCHGLMLVFALVLLGTTLTIGWTRIRGRRAVARPVLGVQIASGVAVLIVYLVWAADFFGSAFDGVG